MYSQYKEEEIITKFFKGFTGRFLDIGAYDGKTFSNTLKLAEQGWSGICLEPSPSVYPSLEKQFFNSTKIKTIQIALGSETKILDIYDSNGDAISTFVEEHKQLWEKNNKVQYKKVKVQMVKVDEFFSKFGCDFDFINIDAESMDYEIFKQLPFAKLTKLKLICVEHNNKLDGFINLAVIKGFIKKEVHFGNLFLVRK